jgi:hypothetical protein
MRGSFGWWGIDTGKVCGMAIGKDGFVTIRFPTFLSHQKEVGKLTFLLLDFVNEIITLYNVSGFWTLPKSV